MGQRIGLQCARYGYSVTLYDISPDALESAAIRVRAYADQLVVDERMTREEADATLGRIVAINDLEEAAAEADLLSESVPENPELKRKVFAQLSGLCPSRTIFTTNTSTLLPSMFAEATGRPAQFAALHFHGLPWGSNVVDIMPHPGTSSETIELLYAFAERIGQIPIVLKKESHRYVFNAMFDGLLGAALTLVRTRIASVEDIDRAWMGCMKMPRGPFGMLDGVGLDTAWEISQYWAKELDDPERQAIADFLREYVDKGWLGIKSGRGFYSYPDPAYRDPGFLTGRQDPSDNHMDGSPPDPVECPSEHQQKQERHHED